MTEHRTTPDNPATSQINAPWTADQVTALERFQTEGHMHPFTCGGEQHNMAPRMIPSRSGWHCPDPDCSYTQGWAHAFMAQPAAWPGRQYRLTAAPVDPEVERKAEERAAQAAANSEKAAAWLVDNQGDASLRDQYAAAINAKIDGTEGCANGRRLADAVLAVRDQEMEQLRAELNRVHERACRLAERLRKAEARVTELEKLLADELTALDQPQQPEAKAPVGWTSSCRCHSREGLAPQQHENDCPDAIAQPQQPTIGIYAADPDCETGDVRTCTVACTVHGETTEQQPTTTEAPC